MSRETLRCRCCSLAKQKNPRCFTGINQSMLPVIYRNQQNAWMDTEIFSWWFHKQCVPFVRATLSDMGLEEKAILFLDNCSAHPEAEDLISNDGKITARFFRLNVTALTQPMDQGVLESMKRVYRKNLLRDLMSKTSNEMIPFLKEMTMLDVINHISIAWDQVASDTIRKSWGKVIPLPVPDVNEGVPYASEEVMELLTELDVDASQKDINDWLKMTALGMSTSMMKASLDTSPRQMTQKRTTKMLMKVQWMSQSALLLTKWPWMLLIPALHGSNFSQKQQLLTQLCCCSCANLLLKSKKVAESKLELNHFSEKIIFLLLFSSLALVDCHLRTKTVSVLSSVFPSAKALQCIPFEHPVTSLGDNNKLHSKSSGSTFRHIRTALQTIEFNLFG